MRIISKYKDYYDYYQGIFGMDKSKVYDRRGITKMDLLPKQFEPNETEIDFYICGIKYRMLLYNGVLYHTPEEMKELNNLLLEQTLPYRRHIDGINFSFWHPRDDTRYQLQYDIHNGIKTNVNHKLRQPVLYTNNASKDNFKTPLLTDFNFHKIMDAKELYIEIETFLGWLVDNPPLPDEQTNVGKIEGHGFDKKSSFRPNMKNN